jgi:hypothetical protein
MKNKSKKNEALERQLAALLGDPTTADSSEVESLYEEFGTSADLVQMAYEQAAQTAQRYRLAGKAVPPHVQAALAQTKAANTLEGVPTSKLGEIVDWALKPFRGPTETLAFSHHRLTHNSEKDKRLLKQLADEVKENWAEEDEVGRR